MKRNKKLKKPYFSNKGLNSNKPLLKEKGRLISDEKKQVDLRNSFFMNITAELDLKKNTETFLVKNYNFGMKSYRSLNIIQVIKE